MQKPSISSEAVAELKDVYKRFGRQEVLRGINLSLEKGRVTGLLGPSGSGKTTIVNMLVGTYRPTTGSVTVLGDATPFQHVRAQMGFMPQSEALYNDLTANQNLRFFGALCGLKKHQMDAAIPRTLKLVRLGDEGRKVVSNFSGGMKRRLSLAIALLHEPELLILDEPTVGLDPRHRVELWEAFRARAAAGAALLVTTHVMDEAAGCDRLVMIHDGRVIADGTPQQLVADTQAANLEEAFLTYERLADEAADAAEAEAEADAEAEAVAVSEGGHDA